MNCKGGMTKGCKNMLQPHHRHREGASREVLKAGYLAAVYFCVFPHLVSVCFPFLFLCISICICIMPADGRPGKQGGVKAG